MKPSHFHFFFLLLFFFPHFWIWHECHLQNFPSHWVVWRLGTQWAPCQGRAAFHSFQRIAAICSSSAPSPDQYRLGWPLTCSAWKHSAGHGFYTSTAERRLSQWKDYRRASGEKCFQSVRKHAADSLLFCRKRSCGLGLLCLFVELLMKYRCEVSRIKTIHV